MTESAHCGRKGCDCTHDGPCFKGWIEWPRREYNGIAYEQTGPCPRCRLDLMERLHKEGFYYAGGPTPLNDVRSADQKERDRRGMAKVRAAYAQSVQDEATARGTGLKRQADIHAYVQDLREARGDSVCDCKACLRWRKMARA